MFNKAETSCNNASDTTAGGCVVGWRQGCVEGGNREPLRLGVRCGCAVQTGLRVGVTGA
jgi:hypothetical protein